MSTGALVAVVLLSCLSAGLIVAILIYRRMRPDIIEAETALRVSERYGDELRSYREQLEEFGTKLDEVEADYRRQLEERERIHALELQEQRHQLELQFSQSRTLDRRAGIARSRTMLVAKVAEHLGPLLDGFPYNLKDCRHIGELFDFLVLDGLEEGKIRNIVFLEVKTKRSGRVSNPREKLLRSAIIAKRVKYEVWVPNLPEPPAIEAAIEESEEA